MKTSWEAIGVSILLAVFLILTIGSNLRESFTFDEIVNIQEGVNNVSARTFLIEPYNPPLIRELTAIPIIFGLGNGMSRLIISGLALGLLITVYVVTRSLFGIWQAYLALFLLVFDPNLLAHSHYITPDIGITFFFFLCFSVFLYARTHPTTVVFIVLGIVFGLSAASKVPALFFGPAIMGVAMVLLRKSMPVRRIPIRNWSISVIVAAVVVWGTYWFGWKPILIRHDNPARVSNQIINVATMYRLPLVVPAIEALFNTPVPLGDYIGIVKNNILRIKAAQTGQTLSYIWFLKTPLPFIILLIVALYQWWRTDHNKRNPYETVFIVVSIFLALLFIVAGLSGLVRYLLPLTPFLTVVASGSMKFFQKKRLIVLLLMLIWYCAGTLMQFPHFISYANELAASRKYTTFTDSNIDWGQGLLSFATYVKTVKPKRVIFSYFGRDNADRYGFISDKPWGSHKNNEICELHTVELPDYTGPEITAISITNWRGCGYEKQSQYRWEHVKNVVGESILIF